jgi:hypothetical protein
MLPWGVTGYRRRRSVGVYEVYIGDILFFPLAGPQGTGPYVAEWCTFGAPVIVSLNILAK